MPPKGKADLAHPQAADWVMGTLGPDEAVGFQLHLKGCLHCQAAVAEFTQLGKMLQNLPPSVEPSAKLEALVIASVLAAVAEDRTPTQVQHVPAVPLTGTARRRGGGGAAKVFRFPRWPGRPGLIAIAGAVAAAVISAAVVILPGLGGGGPAAAFAFSLRSPSGASGTVTAGQDPSGSWDITVTVHDLPHTHGEQVYECWYLGRGQPGHQPVASAGTFVMEDGGSGTFHMTSAADPKDFPTMEIVREPGSTDGALRGMPVLTGHARKL